MKTAIILHGMPSRAEYFDPQSATPSNSHWLPWAQKQLLEKEILAQTPEMPAPYSPDYNSWRSCFEQFNLAEETILIGHSCGAGFLVRWLSENNVRVNKVVLVAPWIDPANKLHNDFFNFEMNPDLVERTHGITIMVSRDDNASVQRSAAIIAEKITGVKTVTFDNLGHFTLGDMGTDHFTELLDVLAI